jgi:hypothetical protein
MAASVGSRACQSYRARTGIALSLALPFAAAAVTTAWQLRRKDPAQPGPSALSPPGHRAGDFETTRPDPQLATSTPVRRSHHPEPATFRGTACVTGLVSGRTYR